MREKNDIHSFTASIVTYSKKRRELEECTNTYKIMQKLIEDLLSNEACEWIAVIDNSKDKIFEPREDNKNTHTICMEEIWDMERDIMA